MKLASNTFVDSATMTALVVCVRYAHVMSVSSIDDAVSDDEDGFYH